MKILLRTFSYLGLALTVLPSFFVFGGSLSLPKYKLLMLVGTMLWVCTAPFWINTGNDTPSNDDKDYS